MARVVTVAFPVPSGPGYAEEGEVVSTLPGVYWQVQSKEHRPGEVWLQLWPVDGHAADRLDGHAPRQLPMKIIREVLPAEQFGPSGAAA